MSFTRITGRDTLHLSHGRLPFPPSPQNLVTPRSKPGSPTGHLSNSSSSASLIRVPSLPKAVPKPAAPEPVRPACELGVAG